MLIEVSKILRCPLGRVLVGFTEEKNSHIFILRKISLKNAD